MTGCLDSWIAGLLEGRKGDKNGENRKRPLTDSSLSFVHSFAELS